MAVEKLKKTWLPPDFQALWKVESESQTRLSELEGTKEEKAKGLIMSVKSFYSNSSE